MRCSAWGRSFATEVAAKLGNYEQLGKRAAAAIPKATLVELPGIGHALPVENPHAVAACM